MEEKRRCVICNRVIPEARIEIVGDRVKTCSGVCTHKNRLRMQKVAPSRRKVTAPS